MNALEEDVGATNERFFLNVQPTFYIEFLNLMPT